METEKRLIDANVLKWKLGQVRLYVPWLRFGKTVISKILESYRRDVFKEIDNAPTVDAAEVVHGEWVQIGYDKAMDRISCSCCMEYWNIADNDTESFNYCPNCGAKMDGERRTDNDIQ